MKTKKAPSKKRTTAGRKPRRLTPVPGSQTRYAFVNNKGKLMWIDDKTTIPELLKMGVRNITLEPIGSPMPIDPRVFVHAPSSENVKTVACSVIRPPNLVQIGDLWICEDEDQVVPDKIEFALLIQCSSAEQCRAAMKAGKIEFTVFEHYSQNDSLCHADPKP